MTLNGPLRNLRIAAGAGGVRVSIAGQSLVDVRNDAQGPSGGAVESVQPADDELTTIALGRFIAEQQQPVAQRPADDGNDDDAGQGIIVGPITPIPAPKPQPIARLGL